MGNPSSESGKESFRVAVLGTGTIAGTVAQTLRQMPEVSCYAVGSRNRSKAEAFAKRYGFEKAYGSYEELLRDDGIELVYIATPHSHHSEHIRLCAEHGRAVLCEKSFTVNAQQAREAAQLARERGVYAAEAIWPRYMPSRRMIDEALASGEIGRVHTMTANLSYAISGVPRLLDPKLAGGALLDVGVYGVNFLLMHFDGELERIETAARMTETGVDGSETITAFFRDGRMAVLTHGMYARSDRLLRRIEVPEQISGYEYEFQESIRCIREGRTESESMPLSESVRMMEWMDRVRAKWGLKYPGEE